MVVTTVGPFASALHLTTIIHILRSMRCRVYGHKGSVGKAIHNERYVDEGLRAGSNWRVARSAAASAGVGGSGGAAYRARPSSPLLRDGRSFVVFRGVDVRVQRFPPEAWLGSRSNKAADSFEAAMVLGLSEVASSVIRARRRRLRPRLVSSARVRRRVRTGRW